MKVQELIMVAAVSLLIPNVCVAKTPQKMSEIYQARCANCHGIKADGVPKLKEQSEMSVAQAAAQGVASQEKINIFGPPLNTIAKEELTQKLKNLRNKDFDNQSYHSEMRKNLKKIEEREGKISDEEMANYISSLAGTTAK